MKAKPKVEKQPETIVELPEEFDKTSVAESRYQVEKELTQKEKVIVMFKQIDSAPLAKIMVPKAQLSEQAIPQVHQYSLLMRFRGGKNLNAVEPFVQQN